MVSGTAEPPAAEVPASFPGTVFTSVEGPLHIQSTALQDSEIGTARELSADIRPRVKVRGAVSEERISDQQIIEVAL